MNFDEMLSKIDSSLDDFKQWIDKIIKDCNRWAPWLKPVAAWMGDAIDWLQENVRKLLSEIGKFFTRPGHPIALWESGNRWAAEVGKRAGDQVGVITIGFMNADDKWKGDAADAYFKACRCRAVLRPRSTPSARRCRVPCTTWRSPSAGSGWAP